MESSSGWDCQMEPIKWVDLNQFESIGLDVSSNGSDYQMRLIGLDVIIWTDNSICIYHLQGWEDGELGIDRRIDQGDRYMNQLKGLHGILVQIRQTGLRIGSIIEWNQLEAIDSDASSWWDRSDWMESIWYHQSDSIEISIERILAGWSHCPEEIDSMKSIG